MLRIIAYAVCLLVCLAVDLNPASGADWIAMPNLCDQVPGGNDCDGMQSMRSCLKPSQRGTVGSLFQWSGHCGELAQPNEPLITDRPDFTEASSVVGLGVLQLETGYTYTRNSDGADQFRGNSFPEALFRYGVFRNWLELRVAWNYGDDETNGVSASGSDDLYLGFKIGLTPQNGLLPEMAIIPQMTVPTGSSNRTEDEVLAGLNWLYGWDINDFLSAAGSTQFNRSLDGVTGNGYTEWAQSWTFGYSLGERTGAYTEYFGLYPTGADTVSPEHYFNGGITRLITDDILWDIRAGAGLNDAADDFLVGTGLSIRFR